MKNLKKKIVVIALIVAIFAMTIASATITYFTDTSAQKNTFVVGDVEIDLGTDEPIVFDNVYPAQTLDVKGVISNTSERDGVYVAGIIEFTTNDSAENNIADLLDTEEKVVAFLNGLNVNVDAETVGTKIVIDETTGTITVYVVLDTILANGGTFALFNNVKVPAKWDKAEMAVLANTTLTVKAYATQTVGFNNGAEAIDGAFGGGADSSYDAFAPYFAVNGN